MGANASCPSCGGKVDVKSRHVAVTGTEIRIYCSEECLSARDAPPRRARWIAVCLVAGTAGLVLGKRATASQVEVEPLPPSVLDDVLQPRPEPEAPVPTEAAPQPDVADAIIIDELAHDAWIHPLA